MGTPHRFPIGVVHRRDDAANDNEASGLVQVIPGSLWRGRTRKRVEGDLAGPTEPCNTMAATSHGPASPSTAVQLLHPSLACVSTMCCPCPSSAKRCLVSGWYFLKVAFEDKNAGDKLPNSPALLHIYPTVARRNKI